MTNKSWIVCAVMALACAATHAADLTATERTWLAGIWPVVEFAKQSKLPLDIVVQPQPTPGKAPLALGFVDGRCKLVLSMRGNDEAQATLDRIEPELRGPALELMAAHELGHCRRYLDGAWLGLPSGFAAHAPHAPDGLSPPVREAYLTMQAARREEGYADLVGLAWTQQRHPQSYARLHAWLSSERSKDLVDGSPHDTLAWIGRANDASVWTDRSIFAAANVVWTATLAAQK